MKKSNPCHQCNPCLNFCPSPKADGHYYSLIYLFSVSHGYIHSVFLTDIFILCFSQIILFRVVVVSPAFGVDTNQKKKHGYHLTLIGLSRIFLIIFFFDIILANDSWIGVMDLFGFASVDTLPFLEVWLFVTPHIDFSPHLASPEGEGQLLLLLIND